MSNKKSETEVLIGGKVFYISSLDSEEYIQKLASYINSKMMEFTSNPNYRLLNKDYQNIFLGMNIADELFKAQDRIKLLEDELKVREDEVYNVKHQLVNTQVQLDSVNKSLASTKEVLRESEKKVFKLETELKEQKRN